MAARKRNATRIKFPKIVSNKLTKRLGIANMIIHKTSNNVIKPTTKLRFFLEKIPLNEKFIVYNILLKKKLNANYLKKSG